MSGTIVAQKAEVWVSRDYGVYTHKIYRNGVLASASIISESRAKEIIGATPDGRVRGSEPVTFEPGAKQFTWIAWIEEAR